MIIVTGLEHNGSRMAGTSINGGSETLLCSSTENDVMPTDPNKAATASGVLNTRSPPAATSEPPNPCLFPVAERSHKAP